MFTALDSDVIKTYVELGVGIGLVAAMAYEPEKDVALRMIDLAHLFPPSTTWVGLRKNSFLRSYVYSFIEKLVPGLAPDKIRSVVQAN